VLLPEGGADVEMIYFICGVLSKGKIVVGEVVQSRCVSWVCMQSRCVSFVAAPQV